jgi:acetyltransferase
VGGVRLDLRDADAVRGAWRAIHDALERGPGLGAFDGVTVQPMVATDGYELILGSSVDAQLGPLLLFGMGGQLVEVFRDRALGLPPLNTTLARRMIEQTRIATALRGVRGRAPVDMDALEQMLVRFSMLVVEQRAIAELDINPLLASSDRLLALDARVVLHDPGLSEQQLPRLAIRPYPRRYVEPWTAPDGTPLLIRPIRPEDEPLIVAFHHELTEETVYARYFAHLGLPQRTAHERLTRVCFNDFDREMALVAEETDRATGEVSIVAVGRLSRSHVAPTGEFALLVADRWQRRGLGRELLGRLIRIAKDEGLERIWADMLAVNVGMRRVAESLGFAVSGEPTEGTLRAELDLTRGRDGAP